MLVYTVVVMDARAKTVLRKTVWAHYRTQGRHDLPWRHVRDPYRILVSEVMLQQTQVARVVPYYRAFLKRFPSVRALAQAPLSDVLIAWQGLGYNRRAKALHDAARSIVASGGRFPRTVAELVRLPGIGPYTASAICVFAYDEPLPLVETNIRTVLFHTVLAGRVGVPDSEVLQLTVVLMDRKRPREWHWALMDYGSHLKAQGVRVNALSKHYVKQSKFEGSDRQARGAILRLLASGPALIKKVPTVTGVDEGRCARALESLKKEKLIRISRGAVSLSRE